MRNKINTILLLGFLFGGILPGVACSREPEQRLAPAGSPMTAHIHFEYAIYMMSSRAKKPSTVLHRELERKFADLKVVAELPDQPKEMVVHIRAVSDVLRNYAPPDLEALKYSGHGISKEQALALQKSGEAFVLEFAHPKENVWTALQNANQLVEDIARETGGLIWDEETREIFSPDAWHEERMKDWQEGVPDVSTQTVIHAYNNGEFARAITLGMAKAGLPDVVIEELPWSSETQVGHLINAFSQSMAEGASFRNTGKFRIDLQNIRSKRVRDSLTKSLEANATGVACLTLKQGTHEEGDAKNELVELTFDAYPGSDAHAKQDAALDSFFGWRDSVLSIEHTDELLEVSRKAKSNLPRLHRDFDAGLQPGEYILVKAPFKTADGGNEWMWVEVRSWKEDRITGLLENEPDKIPDLHGGQLVEVREDEVFDYIRRYPDKHAEGNTTGEIILKMEQEKEVRSSRKPLALPACTD